MKKIFIVLLGGILLFGLTACGKNTISFKKEYESLNGQTNKAGKEHRTISIDEDNPYVKVSPESIVEKINNNETFYLYVGDPLCPWCRSVLEKSIEVAKTKGIETIYYIEIWDDDGNEILRDKYELKDGEPVKTIEGTEAYSKLLKAFAPVLSNYTLTNGDGTKVAVGENRIFAPNYFYVKDGTVVKMTDGISKKQKDSREELTEEMLKDEEELFNSFFDN